MQRRQNTYSTNNATAGIWRAKVIKDCENGKAIVYIPALHRNHNPFKMTCEEQLDENGEPKKDSSGNVIKKVSVTNELRDDYAQVYGVVPENETQVDGETPSGENSTGSATDESSESAENNNPTEGAGNTLLSYPTANICSWQVRTKLNVGDPVWVMFENGNIAYPVIVGQLGTTLPVGTVGCNGHGSDGGGGGTISSDNATVVAVFNAIVNSGKGYNSAAACGVIANMSIESPGFVCDHNDGMGVHDVNGPSYGLCQWHNVGDFNSEGRFTNLRNYCSNNGLDYRTVEGQISFLLHELDTSETSAASALRKVSNDANGAYQAGYDFCRLFERCASTGEYPKRGNIARDTYWPKVKGDSLIISGGSVAATAAQWAVQIANDSSHGYSQANRMGPDYDCSSLIGHAYAFAGVNIPKSSTTYSMDGQVSGVTSLTDAGFVDVTSQVNISTGANLQVGDVMWKQGHVEMICSVNPLKLVGAHSNRGYPQTGDQKDEISVTNYINGWTKVFRYNK